MYEWKFSSPPHSTGKKIHIFFFPSLPQMLSVLYQGTGSDFPYYHPHHLLPSLHIWLAPSLSVSSRGRGESLWVSFSTGKRVDRLVLKCGSSSALLSESLPVSVGTGSVELSNGSRSVFNHITFVSNRHGGGAEVGLLMGFKGLFHLNQNHPQHGRSVPDSFVSPLWGHKGHWVIPPRLAKH